MNTVTPHLFYYGQNLDLPEQLPLRAGALTLLYENGTLRHIQLGDTLMVQQIYSAVRDQNWGTIEPVFSDMHITQTADSFAIRFVATHHQHDIHFVWQGSITGATDGTIVFSMDGTAHSDFLRNRIGFCVLHPATCAGLPCTIEHVDGTRTNGSFPQYIAPHQPFFDIRAITFAPYPGLQAEVRMEGASFEMEDQRNWTDASYKTYCTPLGLPFPVQIKKGDTIAQKITLRLFGTPPTISLTDRALSVTINNAATMPLPTLGLGCASPEESLSDKALQRLKTLNLAHLRVDLDQRQPNNHHRLQRATHDAVAIGTQLEIAVTLTANAHAELESLAESIAALQPPIVRWLIFHANEKSTSAQWVMLARTILAKFTPDAAFGGGTDAFFTELNRGRPTLDALDVVTFSTNPQVHAFDNLSWAETLPVHRDLVLSARQFVGEKPIIVSPVTFKMRWNPNATGAETPTADGELPRRVDVRQMSLFGAGWTMGNLKYFAEAGVASLTYYETHGWLGIMETENGSPLPQKFHSYAGGVYPIYHVFADVGAFAGGQISATHASDTLKVVALALQHAGKQRILLANLTPTTQTVYLDGLNGMFAAYHLDETHVEMAMRDPEMFRAQSGDAIVVEAGKLRVQLLPYALCRLDKQDETA